MINRVSEDEITRLYKRFMKLDKDGSGTIDKSEFLALPQIKANPLAHRMLDVFDADAGGDVDFKEFIIGLSAFSAKGNGLEKLKFAFRVYDIDRGSVMNLSKTVIFLMVNCF